MTATIATLRQTDERLVRAGHHPLTDVWLEQLTRFYAHSTATTLVAQVGRGGVKSHTSAKVALSGNTGVRKPAARCATAP